MSSWQPTNTQRLNNGTALPQGAGRSKPQSLWVCKGANWDWAQNPLKENWELFWNLERKTLFGTFLLRKEANVNVLKKKCSSNDLLRLAPKVSSYRRQWLNIWGFIFISVLNYIKVSWNIFNKCCLPRWKTVTRVNFWVKDTICIFYKVFGSRLIRWINQVIKCFHF